MHSLTASGMAAGISLPLTSQFRKALRRSASTSLPTSRAVTVSMTLPSLSARRQALQSTSLQALRSVRVAAVVPPLLQATKFSPTTSTRPRLLRLSAQERAGRISISSTAGKTRPARASRVYPTDIRAFQQGPTVRPTAVIPTIADQVPTTSSSAPTVYS